ncbi:alpha-xylosidase [Paenibacillus ginsengarvi]|uniref:Glycoside hydrolase family 31 protein n=1 Tax=Paenibacillus ginsengarvi TaxID=400777 RepID=A0A3B0BU58_9BACL|nr:TIM-barrel domain-containing protein [Paenibacillus ginsengarvi]RKN75824.1 glycoside hydrolase family 31 protein [Paenibacillus ginsengarvi]
MSSFETESLNQSIDIIREFKKTDNTFFLGARVDRIDPSGRSGLLRWKRFAKKPRFAFNQGDFRFEPTRPWTFPNEYAEEPALPFELSFVSPRTVRLRVKTRPGVLDSRSSVMLDGELPGDEHESWSRSASGDAGEGGETAGPIVWSSPFGSVTIERDPLRFVFRDGQGRKLTGTYHYSDTTCLVNSEPTPFSFVRSTSDMRQALAASFCLSPGEKLYGCGESFTRLDKRGQKIDLWVKDAHGVQTSQMYKPVPLLLSSRGYGMFVHSSAPMTFDMGCSYDEANVLYCADETLDLFFFFGQPKDILSEYTALTGRSPVPPLWSFGLWMSRITYKSEREVRETAGLLRQHRIPCDVLHLDTGWFEKDWQCDYTFSPSRFNDAQTMIADLHRQGFRTSLWQLPYFTPSNELFAEIIDRGLAIRDADGELPTEDAILDFSNPETVRWYQQKLAGLLKLGVGAFKVDFGEAAPRGGQYHSGKSGFYEHNLYPLRYNQAAADITRQTTGEAIIWARSAWAGSQRYPLHWGGDAEISDSAMAASLRGGLSLGLSGFTYWSHDIGGFTRQSPEALYRRWLPFGLLVSHSRCHGAPPKEPWEYGDGFVESFREAAELRYKLMPYIYTQAWLSSKTGHPMIRTLFFEFPDDQTSWTIEDAYLFGSDLLVAPLLEEGSARDVYLPPGRWIDYQSGLHYEGRRWQTIEAGNVPVVLLVRDGAIIPHAALAQHTGDINWDDIQYRRFASVPERTGECGGYYYHPLEQRLYELRDGKDGVYKTGR